MTAVMYMFIVCIFLQPKMVFDVFTKQFLSNPKNLKLLKSTKCLWGYHKISRGGGMYSRGVWGGLRMGRDVYSRVRAIFLMAFMKHFSSNFVPGLVFFIQTRLLYSDVTIILLFFCSTRSLFLV